MFRCLAGVLALLVGGVAVAQQPASFASSPPPLSVQPVSNQEPVPPGSVPPPTLYPPPPTVTLPPADGGLFPEPAAPPAKLWKGSFEAGANGATGNTEVFNTRVFWTADRKTPDNLFHTDMLYMLGSQNGMTNQNTMIANVRNEKLFPGSPWSVYALTFVDYDELRDYKFMIGLYGGLGYLVTETDDLFFKLRGGAGTIYKTGGRLGDVWEPSLNFGYDFKSRITERSALVSVLDYYPSFDDFSDFLLRLKVAYEVTIDPENGLFLRAGIFERYDSSPGPGKDKSDLNYFLTLGFNF